MSPPLATRVPVCWSVVVHLAPGRGTGDSGGPGPGPQSGRRGQTGASLGTPTEVHAVVAPTAPRAAVATDVGSLGLVDADAGALRPDDVGSAPDLHPADEPAARNAVAEEGREAPASPLVLLARRGVLGRIVTPAVLPSHAHADHPRHRPWRHSGRLESLGVRGEDRLRQLRGIHTSPTPADPGGARTETRRVVALLRQG